jgi:hypothetical protein
LGRKLVEGIGGWDRKKVEKLETQLDPSKEKQLGESKDKMKALQKGKSSDTQME